MVFEKCLSVIIKFCSNLPRQSKSSRKASILSLNELLNILVLKINVQSINFSLF